MSTKKSNSSKPKNFSRSSLVVSSQDKASKPLKTVSTASTRTAAQNWIKRYLTETTSGNKITEDNVISIDVVFTCIRVLAESIATLPLSLMQKDREGNTKKSVDHSLYELVRHEPNEELTSYELRFWMMVDALLRGRGVAQVLRDGSGKPIALWPLNAARLSSARVPGNGQVAHVYTYVEGSETKEVLLEDDEVLQLQFMPHGGLIGHVLVEDQRNSLGTAKGSEDYASEYFKNGGAISGMIEVPEELSEEAYARLKKDWKESHTAQGKRHGVPVLEGDAKFHPVSLNHEESQLLESRKYSRSTISGLFRIPAHLINDLEKATFSNIEHQDLGFAKHTLRPWMTNWEGRLRKTLLTAKEKSEGYYFKHNDRDLLRGDFKTRSEGYASLINAGVMSPNDARRAEDMNPYEGGDVYLVQGALRDINSPPVPIPPKP